MAQKESKKCVMTNAAQIKRAGLFLLIFPLAIAIGYFLSQPDNFVSMAMIGVVLLIGVLPLLMKWHHPLLILTWNAGLNAFFLPGQLDLWIVMAMISFFFLLWRRTISREAKVIFVPSVGWPLLILGVVVVGTALARGGIGLQAFGSGSVGARRYVSLIAAVVGFFALASQPLPKKHAAFFGCAFFLSGVMVVMSDVVYAAGPNFYFLYYLFPPQLARLQAIHDILGGDTLLRLEGVAAAALAFSCFMLAKFGVRGILEIRRPWRVILFMLVVGIGLLGGFRTRLFLTIMFFIAQFFLEGLWRTRWLPILLSFAILGGLAILPFTERLPESFQRTLSFLPVQVSPNVQRDAQDTVTWRVEMWQALSPEVPRYFWLGKGYAFSGTDLYLTELAQARGLAKDYETMMLVAEYHNGPLSVLIPFGIWGMIIFVWFLIAGGLLLYRNYRYGDKDLKTINTFFLAYYSVMAVFFFTIYGAFNSQLFFFTGVLGLSLSINGGVKKRTSLAMQKDSVLQLA